MRPITNAFLGVRRNSLFFRKFILNHPFRICNQHKGLPSMQPLHAYLPQQGTLVGFTEVGAEKAAHSSLSLLSSRRESSVDGIGGHGSLQ